MADLSQESWEAIKRKANLYFVALEIKEAKRKASLLLFKCGEEFQELYERLPKEDKRDGKRLDAYETCIATLDKHFTRTSNKFFERHTLRKLIQNSDESIEHFVTRLRTQSSKCQYSKTPNGVNKGSQLDEEILQQMIEGCKSNLLRTKLLTKEHSLEDAIEIGKTLDRVQDELKDFKKEEAAPIAWVQRQNKYHRKSGMGGRDQWKSWERSGRKPVENERRCFDCNQVGHLSKQAQCPALGKQCKNCFKYGHFDQCCRKRKGSADTRPPQKRARYCEEVIDLDEPKDYFSFYTGSKANILNFSVGGVDIDLVVDSGSDVTIIQLSTFDQLKKKGAQYETLSYNGDGIGGVETNSKLNIHSCFIAEIKAGLIKSREKFYVCDNLNADLLGSDAAKALKVLKVGYNVGMIQDNRDHGFPTLQGYTVKLFVDPSVRPVIQKLRRPPVAIEDTMTRKIEQMLKDGIIERVETPAEWVSALVPIKKENGDYRVTVDFRRLNQAIKTQGYQMPDVESFLTSIPHSTKFSKIDFPNAFFLIELDEESRRYTTFITISGLYRFKRLPMGLKCSPEEYQKAMDQVFAGLKGK